MKDNHLAWGEKYSRTEECSYCESEFETSKLKFNYQMQSRVCWNCHEEIETQGRRK